MADAVDSTPLPPAETELLPLSELERAVVASIRNAGSPSTVPERPSREEWDTLHAEVMFAQAARDQVERDFRDKVDAGICDPDGVYECIRDAVDARLWPMEEKLLLLPSPDRPALLEKFRIVRKVDFELEGEFWNEIVSDVERLLYPAAML